MNMRPSSAVSDALNNARSYAVLFCEPCKVTQFVVLKFIFDLYDLCFVQFCQSRFAAAWGISTPFKLSVDGIQFVVSCEQVVWIAACRIVATVTNQFGRLGIVGNSECDSMCHTHLIFLAAGIPRIKAPIPLFISESGPFPTLVRSFLFDFIPERPYLIWGKFKDGDKFASRHVDYPPVFDVFRAGLKWILQPRPLNVPQTI